MYAASRSLSQLVRTAEPFHSVLVLGATARRGLTCGTKDGGLEASWVVTVSRNVFLVFVLLRHVLRSSKYGQMESILRYGKKVVSLSLKVQISTVLLLTTKLGKCALKK